jgi:hypothetical protein
MATESRSKVVGQPSYTAHPGDYLARSSEWDRAELGRDLVRARSLCLSCRCHPFRSSQRQRAPRRPPAAPVIDFEALAPIARHGVDGGPVICSRRRGVQRHQSSPHSGCDACARRSLRLPHAVTECGWLDATEAHRPLIRPETHPPQPKPHPCQRRQTRETRLLDMISVIETADLDAGHPLRRPCSRGLVPREPISTRSNAASAAGPGRRARTHSCRRPRPCPKSPRRTAPLRATRSPLMPNRPCSPPPLRTQHSNDGVGHRWLIVHRETTEPTGLRLTRGPRFRRGIGQGSRVDEGGSVV